MTESRIITTATPTAIPTFDPVPRPPPSAAGSPVELDVGDAVDCAVEDPVEASAVADPVALAVLDAEPEADVEVGPTVAANSNKLFVNAQQVLSPQHHFPSPHHWTTQLSFSSSGFRASQTSPRQYSLCHVGSVQPWRQYILTPLLSPVKDSKFAQSPLVSHVSSAMPV